MSTMTPDEVRRGLFENRQAPYGAARNAHAEALSAAAEATGDRALLRQALDNQIDAYEFTAERTKMLVPFARLLQEYDRDPAAFSSGETHSLFWQFKWVATAISNSPEISLESAAGWIAEMERRYRIAGYSERPVREAELFLAEAMADDARAQRAAEAFMAAERDSMSDCHACELNTQGWFWSHQGDDAKAVEVWQPVLDGGRSCAEEPHRTLANSLLPLLRLGRLDEARAHHLRGYRMARGNESLLRSVGKHIEFCALTGNESRGLEILAEHSAHLRPLADLEARVTFYGGVLVLLRRLAELGHGDGPAVPFEGIPRTVHELYGVLHADALDIARRFDARNGNSRVSEQFAERIAQQPLVDLLPLGVRSSTLPAAPAVPPGPTAPVPDVSRETATAFADLVADARAARAQGHPRTEAAWEAVAARVDAEHMDAALNADLLEHRSMTAAEAGDPSARELFAAARDAHRAAGQEDRAALAELRLASAAVQFGAEAEEIRKLLAVAAASAAALGAEEPLRIRRIASVDLLKTRVEAYLGQDDPEVDARCAADLMDFLAGFADTEDIGPLADLLGDAEHMLARLALAEGEPERAEALLTSAASRSLGTGQPWLAVEPLALQAGVLMSLDRPGEAVEAARAALVHAVELPDAVRQGGLRLTLADLLLRTGEAAEAATHALDAAHWFDQAGLAAEGGAYARLLLTRAYARQERTAEAAEVLQSALPDLLEHGAHQGVQAREFLGDLLRELHDPRSAAEQYLLAAETTKDWKDPRPQASLAHSAAETLAGAGLVTESVAAYERALELHREAGDNPVAVVRILRSLAWLYLREESTDATTARARARMEEAAEYLDGATGPELTYELAQTWQQLAQVLDQHVDALNEQAEESEESEGAKEAEGAQAGSAEQIHRLRVEAVELWDRAAGLYAGLGPEHVQQRFQCLSGAAWTDRDLGRAEAGAARMEALAAELRDLPEGTAPDWVLSRAEGAAEALRG
ncbi:tetratricopeptide repeat protein [Streptomyces venezuelae]|uniref:tetratricopeptide repeat protein n=1 Tax=Streptomyces venezuelae TaxID=54571 RepID=UPI001680DC82|nr:tetratricopeptide repeat protein [Streptomyces venezuelae]